MIRKVTAAASAFVLGFMLLVSVPMQAEGFTINSGTYYDMSTYPGIKQFNYATTPVRETIPEDVMVDPEYTFRVGDKTIDEYFGTTGTLTKNGKTYKGVYLNKNRKGQCGVRYNKLFQYQDDWIDVKTTYVDWGVSDETKAFVQGGFCGVSWTCLQFIRLRHEFFKAGTNTPIDIKGFFTYTDVDDSQGIGLLPAEVRGLWTNKNGSDIKYKQTEEGYLFIKDSTGALVDSSMGAERTARVVFSYAFEGTRHDQFILYGKTNTSMNYIGFEAAKKIPSGIPQEDSELIRKQVCTDSGEYEESNALRSWNAEWQYRIAALVPLETEEGNLLDGFRFTDEVDQCIEITGVKILRGAGTDVTDHFDIQIDDHKVVATAEDIHTSSFSGYTYYMLLDVKVSVPEEKMKKHGHFTDDYTAVFKNTATISYADGNGELNRTTNETTTEVIFPYKADITITKRIKTADLYWDHGQPSFIIRLTGKEKSTGEDVEYNRAVTFDRAFLEEYGQDKEFIERSVVFQGVVEGTYKCSECGSNRFTLDSITDVDGGTAQEDHATFTVSDSSKKSATFINVKNNWGDFSDSGIVINKLGK